MIAGKRGNSRTMKKNEHRASRLGFLRGGLFFLKLKPFKIKKRKKERVDRLPSMASAMTRARQGAVRPCQGKRGGYTIFVIHYYTDIFFSFI